MLPQNRCFCLAFGLDHPRTQRICGLITIVIVGTSPKDRVVRDPFQMAKLHGWGDPFTTYDTWDPPSIPSTFKTLKAPKVFFFPKKFLLGQWLNGLNFWG